MVISGVKSRVTIVISHIRGLITPFETTHGPPSTPQKVYAERPAPAEATDPST